MLYNEMDVSEINCIVVQQGYDVTGIKDKYYTTQSGVKYRIIHFNILKEIDCGWTKAKMPSTITIYETSDWFEIQEVMELKPTFHYNK